MAFVENLAPLKAVTVLLTPLGTAFALALLGLLLKRRAVVLVGLAWLWLWSTPWAANRLAALLEGELPRLAAEALPSADVALVLGGALTPAVPGWHAEPNLSAAGDRVLLAAKLYRLGKVPRLLYSGGPTDADGRSEARGAAPVLAALGVPAAALVLENDSRTTRENATAALALLRELGARRVLVVSSAWHLRRALANLRAEAARQGIAIDFLPAPCDPVQVGETTVTSLRWLPNTEALEVNRRLFKEVLGLAWERVGGR